VVVGVVERRRVFSELVDGCLGKENGGWRSMMEIIRRSDLLDDDKWG
jgi:hypothetical protein